MTKSQIKRYQPTSYVKSLFDRCWKMYEEKFGIVPSWHQKHPNKVEIAEWLSMLSVWRWNYYGEDKDVPFEHFRYLELKFDSLEELDLKLTIQGY